MSYNHARECSASRKPNSGTTLHGLGVIDATQDIINIIVSYYAATKVTLWLTANLELYLLLLEC